MNTHPIKFSFRAENSVNFELEAEVVQPEDLPHYQVKNIRLAGCGHRTPGIPDTVIKCIQKAEKRVWVHIDSNLPSALSSSIGQCLEATLPSIALATETDPLAEMEMEDLA